MNRQTTIQELCEVVGMECRVLGSADNVVTRPAPIDAATPDAVTFYSKSAEDAAERIGGTAAGVVVCTPEAAAAMKAPGDRTLLLVSNPRLAFIRIMNCFFAPPRPVGIHPTAVINPEAKLGKDVYVGPFTYIGKAEIGDGTVIDGHVHIYDNVRIGRNCTIQAGAVIGARGFGLERNADGEMEELPHLGGVVLEDNVLVGPHACVDRGTMGDTVIGRGVKIDPFVHVAHNISVGSHTVLCAYAELCGSVRVGDRAWVAPCACIREGLRIGADSLVGMGAVVTRDVTEGATVYGVPAKEVAKQP
jgi:UDP-3-O-[3-hydroxymyristoyl] glucosamine N-acyltransferase